MRLSNLELIKNLFFPHHRTHSDCLGAKLMLRHRHVSKELSKLIYLEHTVWNQIFE